jgi:hypothetical protein
MGASAVPHSEQNLSSPSTGFEQFGHTTVVAAPHSEQNLAPARTSAPHDAQIITTSDVGG